MLLESLGVIVRLGETEFKKTEGYEFPVAEIEEEKAKTILAGEEQKIKRGILPALRLAVPYGPRREVPGVKAVNVIPSKRRRKTRKG